MNKPGERKFHFDVYTLILSIWNKKELPKGWKESIIVPIYRRAIKQIVLIIGHNTFVSYLQNFIQHPALKVRSKCTGSY